MVGNVGDATVKGFDLDFKALIGDNMEFGFNLTDIRDGVEAPDFMMNRARDRADPTVSIRSRHYHYSPIAVIRCTSSTRDRVYGRRGASDCSTIMGASLNQLNDGFTSARLKQGDYKVTDAIFTLDMDEWQARVYVNNLSDERGITYEDSQDFDPLWGRNSSNVIRPRNFGISLRRSF